MDKDNNSLDSLFSAKIDVPESLSPENIEKKLIEFDKNPEKFKDKIIDDSDVITENFEDEIYGDNIENNVNQGDNNSDNNSENNGVNKGENSSKVIKLDPKKRRRFIFSSVAAVLLVMIVSAAAIGYNKGLFQNTSNGMLPASQQKFARENLNKAYDIALSNYKDRKGGFGKKFFGDKTSRIAINDESAVKGIQGGNTANQFDNSASAGKASKSSNDYSKTNVRTEGVDEAEIVKTDGNNIYEYNRIRNCIDIIKVNGKDTERVARISLTKYQINVNQNGFYVQNNKIVVVGTSYKNGGYDYDFYKNDTYIEEETEADSKGSGDSSVGSDDSSNDDSDDGSEDGSNNSTGPAVSATNSVSDCNVKSDDEYNKYIDKNKKDYTLSNVDTFTRALIFDVSDTDNIKFEKGYFLEGEYKDSRLKDGILYLFSSRYMYTGKRPVKKKYESYIPKIQGKCVEGQDLVIQEDYKTVNYTLAASVSLEKNTYIDKKAILGGYGNLYVSEGNIYVMDPAGYSETNIIRISYKKGKLKLEKKGKINGSILNDYCIDESGKYLRLVATHTTTNGNTVNGLYVLNDNLKVVGKLDGLAKGETIYSARFIDDIAYFVTYRETDPLFSVDISDPKKPKLLSYLKIPGFSTYLHPVSDSKLLGIGEEDTDIGREFKLSFYDISNPSNVTESQKTLLDGSSESINNPNAILFDEENHLFGFSMILWNNTASEGWVYDVSGYDNVYQLYSYDDNSYKKVLEVAGDRALRIGDYLYVISIGKEVKAYKVSDLK
ncbi:MAG: beta-propeller domain-containing protein [Lachnospiraceae bacterium]|nr:beta-propeller domain-containing protein [Lachnospiraceae bacterium]